MNEIIKHVAEKIKKDMDLMKSENDFNPAIYIGKTNDLKNAFHRHEKDGYPVLLEIAEGTGEEIASLESKLIELFLNDNQWTCRNKRDTSAGNPKADKLYICLDDSVANDPLYERSEKSLLNNEYPLQLNVNS